MNAPSIYDTIIIRGGPGGSTAGAFLDPIFSSGVRIVPQLDYTET